MRINRPQKFINMLSDSQIERIACITGLNSEALEDFILQVEFWFDDLGKLPTTTDGGVDLNSKYENHAERLRNKLRAIKKLSDKIKKEVDIYNSLSETELAISSSEFDNQPVYNNELRCNTYELIPFSKYLELIIKDVSFRADDHSKHVKASSQRVTELFFYAWGHISIDDESKLLKNSDANPFIQCLSIVTGWSEDLARKNTFKSKWYLERQKQVANGFLAPF